MADNSPYFVFGLGATYPINADVQVGFYVINGYHYLSHINNQPSYGVQIVWKPTARLTLTENLYYGSDQSNTAVKFWRLFSDRILEWKDGPFTFGAAYDVGTENAAELPGHPRTFWTAGTLYAMPTGTLAAHGASRFVLSFIGIATRESPAPNNSSRPSRRRWSIGCPSHITRL